MISNWILALAAAGVADAFWRLPCRGQLANARIDPIVDPGRAATHAHSIQGSSAIGLVNTVAELLGGGCTSCGVKQDMSNYWVPMLYFEHSDGKFEPVTQAGGMLVYYLLYGDNIQPFPSGFRVLAGDPHRRNFTCAVPEPPKSDWTGYELTQPALEQKALGFNCLNYQKTPEASLARHFLPDKDFLDSNCADGVRFEIMFPSCGNGQKDSPDHKSHVAYPSQVMTGDCPAGFETRYPSIFFETIFNTQDFAGKSGRFVLATGDTTGYSNHGDFMEGWESGVLQSAITTCTNPSGRVEDCPIFDLVSESDQQQCKITTMPELLLGEVCDAILPKLPGNNPVTSGPSPAGSDSDDSDDSATVSASVSASVKSSAKNSAKGSSNAAPLPIVPASASAAKAASKASADCARKETVIKGEEAWEICIEEELVTVTAAAAVAPATPAAAAHLKRHVHHHAHGHHA